jgi:hypothetical protein
MRSDLSTLQLRDQWLLTFGIIWVLVGVAWVSRSPSTFPLAHVLGLPPVMAWLVYSFTARHRYWGFFLVDFCYFCNLVGWLFFVGRSLADPFTIPAPSQDGSLAILFSMAIGPLLHANFFWRVTLAFHSPDRMCSCFVHTVAPLACFALRWLSTPNEGIPLLPGAPVSTAFHLFFVPLLAYALWQGLYVGITEMGWTGALLKGDARYTSSLRWQVQSLSEALVRGKGGWLGALAESCGIVDRSSGEPSINPESQATKTFFMASQAVYTVATLGVAAIAWYSFYACMAIVLAVAVNTIFQGAGFYVKVFSKSYLEERSKEVEEAKMIASSASGGGAPLSRSMSTPSCSGGAFSSGPSGTAAQGATTAGASATPLPR